jgi:hypothetical protein
MNNLRQYSWSEGQNCIVGNFRNFKKSINYKLYAVESLDRGFVFYGMIHLCTSSRRFGSTWIYASKFLRNLLDCKLVEWQCRRLLTKSMNSRQWRYFIRTVFWMWIYFHAGNYIFRYACLCLSPSGRRLLFPVSPKTRTFVQPYLYGARASLCVWIYFLITNCTFPSYYFYFACHTSDICFTQETDLSVSHVWTLASS